MIIGVPKEIKSNENRVALTPAGVKELVKNEHKILLQSGAGLGSGITDAEYLQAGAVIVQGSKELWQGAEIIIKVKEPLKEEYGFFREDLTLFTYLHLAAEESLTRALIDKKVLAIAYETIEDTKGGLPLLQPMSEVAGRMATQIGAQLLQINNGGKGIILSGVPGVEQAKVVIVGGGVVGTNAAKIAIGMGAEVIIIDNNIDRLRYLDDIFGARIKTLASNSFNLTKSVQEADLLIGAVLIPGAKAPKLVTKEMVKSMAKGSVIVDVAIDQGGSIETIDRVTTHVNPTYEQYDVIHYSVANMPGAVPRTSTFALTNVTLPFIIDFANNGVENVLASNSLVAKGVNTYKGYCTYEAVAKALDLKHYNFLSLL